MKTWKQFCIPCACGRLTIKSYARAHNGQCKACATGQPAPVKPCEDSEGSFSREEYRLTAEYRAEVSYVPDRETAVLNLSNKLQALDEWQYFRRYYHTKSGETLCLFHTFNGFQYDIVRPGQAVPSSCLMSAETTLPEAIAACERHVDQFNQDFGQRQIGLPAGGAK